MKVYQVLGKGASVMFPVSPKRVLILDDLSEPDAQYYQLKPGREDYYNFLTWVSTDGFLVSFRHTDHILMGIDRAVQEYKREHPEAS
jgi:hypothetical protein